MIKISRREFVGFCIGGSAAIVLQMLANCTSKNEQKIKRNINDILLNPNADEYFVSIANNKYIEVYDPTHINSTDVFIPISILEAMKKYELCWQVRTLFEEKELNKLETIYPSKTIETLEYNDIIQIVNEYKKIKDDNLKNTLSQIKGYYEGWFDNNIQPVYSVILSTILKSYGCELSGLTPEECDRITISEKANDIYPYQGLIIDDQIMYKIDKSSGIPYECFESYNSDFSYTNSNLDLIKKSILCGVKLVDGKIIQEREISEELLNMHNFSKTK